MSLVPEHHQRDEASETAEIFCAECGAGVFEDASPGVFLHVDTDSASGYDLDEDHSARPDVEQ